MQPSDRARELERKYQSRRGHVPQISISDENHHVTEAIGDMYGGDMDYNKRDSRPLSFISSPLGDSLESLGSFDSSRSSPPRSPLGRTTSNERSNPPNANGSPKSPNSAPPAFGRENHNGPMSPTLNRTTSDTAVQQFPLNDIDYESSPAAVAQELSNLQAIRRMSMDVNTSDPDLPSFKSFGMPPVAPQHFSEDEDPSKLFWVPARLHPELAPKEFKTFIEEKVDKIRRRSGDSESLSPEGVGRQGSGSGLRRKKSMLSRQIDSPNGYRDGAERLERKRSGGHPGRPNGGLSNLQELEQLVEDPSSLVRSLSINSARTSSDTGAEVPASEDMPILPSKPGTLKRSTRTNYRRGSLRKGERVPFSRRPAGRQQEIEAGTEDSPQTSPTADKDSSDVPTQGLSRVQTEPVQRRPEATENFSRPTRVRSPPLTQPPSKSVEDLPPPEPSRAPSQNRSTPAKPFHSRIASNGRTTAPLPGYVPPQQVPQIIETPPQEPQRNASLQHPARGSSRNAQQPPPPAQQAPPPRASPAHLQKQPPSRSPMLRQGSPIKSTNQTLDDMAAHPSPLPGNSTRTDSLSFIPTFSDDKKGDRKSKDKKDAGESGSRKTSWGWLLGSDDKEKEKEQTKQGKEDREKEIARKVKNKLSKGPDKSYDNTRLDVLQTSIEGGRGRESLVLDRDTLKLEEERKKESSRKSSGGDAKKDKDSGLFSSLFGGSKKKGEKESGHKKGSSMRGLSPEPPPRILKPDIDYNWTRFSILEERAIYRMAHIKLANPRRELYSQVLLSNFMYSYLAKVQQMHPQIQIGHSAQQKQQKRQEAQQAQQAAQQAAQEKRKEQQSEEFAQYQRYQQQQEQAEKTNNSSSHYTDSLSSEPPPEDEVHTHQRPDSRASHHTQNSQQSSYNNVNGNSYSVSSGQNYLGYPGGAKSQQQPYYGQSLFDDNERHKDDEMW